MGILRPLESADLVSLQAWKNNRNLAAAIHGFRYPINGVMVQKWFEENIVNSSSGRAIFAIGSDDNSICGMVQLNDIDPIHRNARLGIFIGPTEKRGTGIGQQALSEIIQFGFESINLRKIYLQVNASNNKAISLYQKNGFIIEGQLVDHYYNYGQWEDLVLMALFRENLRTS